MWNILIIDDDEIDREFVRRSLHELDKTITIREASHGGAALATLQDDVFDCVLLDFRLPDMDGLTLLHKINEGLEKLAFPVVMMTGEGNEEVAVEAMKLGVYDYVVKGGMLAAKILRESVSNAIERYSLLRDKERAEHALELKAAELAIAMAEAEKANHAKSDFLAAMSHDLRTPLNAIMGFSDMIRSEIYGPLGDHHYAEYATDIYNSGELLISLINDILDLSKVEAGKYDLVEEVLNISDLLHNSFQQVEKMAEKAALTLSMSVMVDMPRLYGDKRVLTQIINNLLSNAIKFTPSGGKIDISAQVADDNAISLCVVDTGIGMTQENQNRALLPFEQIDNDHSRSHEGTGLGLPLCVNFMNLHNGIVVVNSQVGVGTSVSVRFPPERTITSHLS